MLLLEDRHQEGILNRLGLNQELTPWTLRVANQGFKGGPSITRERVRQIEAKYLNRLKKTFATYSNNERVSYFLKDKKLVSHYEFSKFILENNLSLAK